MIILLVVGLILAIEAIVLRKRLVRLATLRFRRLVFIWLALADQILVISILPGQDHTALSIANFLAYVAAGGFLWANRRIPGVLLIGLGGAMNVAAIVANHGTMPASSWALRASGWKPTPGHFVNSALVAHPRLAWLGDIFATPRSLPGHDVFSIGDALIVVGVAILVYRTCSRREGSTPDATVTVSPPPSLVLDAS